MPKFRVFVKSGTKQMYGGVYEEDAMVPVGVLDITGEEVTVWGCGRENCGMCDDYFRMKDIILMQTTGLEDKNGVEIYEGDIVKYFRKGNSVIEWKDGGFIIKRVMDGEYELMQSRIAEMEVIGNIYENPELLEVAE